MFSGYKNMKLTVRVIEARNLPATDLNGLSDPYVRLQLGKQRFRTKVVKKTLNPTWGEEFSFRVDDLDEELMISVLDEDKYFNDDFVGQVKIPISRAFHSDNGSLGTIWHSIQPKNKKSKQKVCGMLCSPYIVFMDVRHLGLCLQLFVFLLLVKQEKGVLLQFFLIFFNFFIRL